MDDPNHPAESAFLQALESGPVKNLLSPVTKELGETIGYIGGIVRFYSHDNLAKIFKRWAESERGGKALEEEEFKRVMPLLPLAAQVSDEELQTHWAVLLESAATGSKAYLPSFGQTLSQLTAEEAAFLDRLYAYLSKRKTQPPNTGIQEPIGRITLIGIYDASIKADYNLFELLVRRAELYGPNEEDRQNARRLEHAELVIQDLERLGVLINEPTEAASEYVTIPRTIAGQAIDSSIAGKKVAVHWNQPEQESMYSLSLYGKGFLRSVLSNKKTH